MEEPIPAQNDTNNNDAPMTEDRAAAVAEVAALPDVEPVTTAASIRIAPRGGGTRANDAADEALQAGDLQNIDGPGAEVQAMFIEFLFGFWEAIEPNANSNEDEVMDDDDENKSQNVKRFYPYILQAERMAKVQLNDDDDDEENGGGDLNSSFATTLFCDYQHINTFNTDLAEALLTDYIRFEPYLKNALKTFLHDLHPSLKMHDDSSSSSTKSKYFVALHNLPIQLSMRSLRTDTIGQLTSVSGTVTRTSDVRPELLIGTFRCEKCGLVAENITQQYHYTRPTLCRNPRCENRREFRLDLPLSSFTDWQKLRVQENSSDVPAGCMPRSMDVIVRNEMVERCKAGDSVVFVGSLVVIPDASALSRAGEAPQSSRDLRGRRDEASGGGGGVKGLKALGVRELTYRTCFVATSVMPTDALERYRNQAANYSAVSMANFLHGTGSGVGDGIEEEMKTTQEVAMEMSDEEKQEIMAMKNSSNLYSKMVESICPNTFGHAEVKRGVLLQLLGGVHKTTAEGIRLRGDINVCIIGDPSVAKSQFLKYVHSFLPSRSIYTSGKASSAAGLTAAVQRDNDTGEYCIEAGALMLADNGICCIDEFDKMDPTDQVAIHEAMEQQTISITKAGIQATLNARASILAAANPIYGRYDRSKTLKANVALSAPILSRFDLFFVVLDECDEMTDLSVARHILKVHRCEETVAEVPFTMEQMQRYIRFARTLHPKVTPESQKVMVECYRLLRQGDTMGRSRTAYRITVRQLESMIRLSEALARLHCDDFVRPSYVREAFRLLKKSIIHVQTEDITFDDDIDENGEEKGDDDGDDDDDNDDNDQGGQVPHAGEYNRGEMEDGDDKPEKTMAKEDFVPDNEDIKTEEPPKKKSKKSKSKKKKTQITFEQYEAISLAITTYLRDNENEATENDKEEDKKPSYPTWGEVADWFISQSEKDIGDTDELKRMKKLVDLVIRRLLNVDHTLVYIGGDQANEELSERDRKIAVHPNYEGK